MVGYVTATAMTMMPMQRLIVLALHNVLLAVMIIDRGSVSSCDWDFFVLKLILL